jgi:hypothetical protein
MTAARRHNLTDKGDDHGRKEKSRDAGQDGIREQRQQNIDSDIAPQDRGQQKIRVLPQIKNLYGITVSLGCFHLESQPADTKKSQVHPRKHG